MPANKALSLYCESDGDVVAVDYSDIEVKTKIAEALMQDLLDGCELVLPHPIEIHCENLHSEFIFYVDPSRYIDLIRACVIRNKHLTKDEKQRIMLKLNEYNQTIWKGFE